MLMAFVMIVPMSVVMMMIMIIIMTMMVVIMAVMMLMLVLGFEEVRLDFEDAVEIEGVAAERGIEPPARRHSRYSQIVLCSLAV